MITNKDIRVENGNLVLNGDKYPLDGQSPEAIMQIVEDNSDTTPTENSTAPITSGGIFTALGTLVTVDPATVTTLPEVAVGANVSFSANATKAGYTPIGIVGIYGSGIRDLTITQFYVDSSNAVVWFTNHTSGTITPSSVTMKVLYVKSF